MENNRIIAIASALAAGTAAVLIALNWSRFNKVFQKKEKGSSPKLKATVHHIKESKSEVSSRKVSKRKNTEDELVASTIPIETSSDLNTEASPHGGNNGGALLVASGTRAE